MKSAAVVTDAESRIMDATILPSNEVYEYMREYMPIANGCPGAILEHMAAHANDIYGNPPNQEVSHPAPKT